MIFNFVGKNKICQLRSRVEGLEKQVESVTKERDGWKEIVEKINKEIFQADVVINWKTINAFSVERCVRDNKPGTIIGYFVREPIVSEDKKILGTNNVVKEWTIHCSEERHRELARQFKEHIKV